MGLFKRRRPREVSVVVVVEAESLDGYEQQRLQDMWWRGMLRGQRLDLVGKVCRDIPDPRERQMKLEALAHSFHTLYKAYQDFLVEKYGPQPYITKFHIVACRGNVTSVPDASADVLAILDLRSGSVL